ncbi:MAG TPA: hypothetical protein VER12_15195 [Polyangiaceae bacterium]|nr:hypothetical protein [Polyangiaceae bacterium]
MAQHAQREFDERLNELSDKDAFWGPLLPFRPDKKRCISSFRALTMAAILGGFYGMLLNLVVVMICRHTGQRVPALHLMPSILTLTYFVAFQLTLGPAWNRRAKLMVRRDGYLDSIGRSEH